MKLATLRELQEYYSYDDALMLLDVIRTDAYNNKIMEENLKPKN